MTLEEQFAEHDKKDAERFVVLENAVDNINKHMQTLATKDDIAPMLEAYNTIRNGRNGLLWIASTLAAIGAVIFFFKGIFK